MAIASGRAGMLKQLAKKFIAIELQYGGDIKDLLGGKLTFCIGVPSENGEIEHSTWAVMEAIYEYYKEHPEVKIDEIMYKSLEEDFSERQYPKHILNEIKMVQYQMMCEKQGTAPFKLDCIKLLNIAAENILEHKDFYQKYWTEEYGPKGSLVEFEALNENLKNHHGQSIM